MGVTAAATASRPGRPTARAARGELLPSGLAARGELLPAPSRNRGFAPDPDRGSAPGRRNWDFDPDPGREFRPGPRTGALPQTPNRGSAPGRRNWDFDPDPGREFRAGLRVAIWLRASGSGRGLSQALGGGFAPGFGWGLGLRLGVGVPGSERGLCLSLRVRISLRAPGSLLRAALGGGLASGSVRGLQAVDGAPPQSPGGDLLWALCGGLGLRLRRGLFRALGGGFVLVAERGLAPGFGRGAWPQAWVGVPGPGWGALLQFPGRGIALSVASVCGFAARQGSASGAGVQGRSPWLREGAGRGKNRRTPP